MEQVVVFIVLLFCFVNSGKTLSRYYTPGMLDTENVLCFGTESKLDGDSLTPEETEKMMRGLCERLRKHSVVEAVSECAFFVPYVLSGRRTRKILWIRGKENTNLREGCR